MFPGAVVLLMQMKYTHVALLIQRKQIGSQASVTYECKQKQCFIHLMFVITDFYFSHNVSIQQGGEAWSCLEPGAETRG